MPDKANGSEHRGWAARIIPILLFSDNWLSRTGIFLVTGATVFWFWMLGLGSTAGYTDIIQYVLLPAMFFLGLALIPARVLRDGLLAGRVAGTEGGDLGRHGRW